MATKRAGGNSEGCAGIIGFAVLVLTLAWPLFAFHRHWTTYRQVNCATYDGGLGDLPGCVFNYQTGGFTGTAVASTSHSAISATGWIVEACWLALLVATFALLAHNSASKRKEAERKAALPGPRDVVDPDISRDRQDTVPGPGQVVFYAGLDEPSRKVLARTQQAIEDILTSTVYAGNELQQAVGQPALRRHEWSIARDLHQITRLRRDQAGAREPHASDSPGPLTKAVLQAQQGALQQKLDTVESLVQAIEQYAGHLKAADRARLDWEAAAELAKLNPRFTDLVAGTAADEHQLREVQDMTDEASTYRESLLQANQAAEALLLADIPADRAS